MKETNNSQESPRVEKSVEILNGKETANGVEVHNDSNNRIHPDTNSPQEMVTSVTGRPEGNSPLADDTVVLGRDAYIKRVTKEEGCGKLYNIYDGMYMCEVTCGKDWNNKLQLCDSCSEGGKRFKSWIGKDISRKKGCGKWIEKEEEHCSKDYLCDECAKGGGE